MGSCANIYHITGYTPLIYSYSFVSDALTTVTDGSELTNIEVRVTYLFTSFTNTSIDHVHATYCLQGVICLEMA